MAALIPVLPDRYEALQRKATNDLETIVVPVADSLALVDQLFARMGAAGRGAFLILRGQSGAGKSTFLNTLRFFREGVKTTVIKGEIDVRSYFRNFESVARLHVHVLEEREALLSYQDRELEEWLHAINGFLRSDNGETSLVVWPCNTDELQQRLVALARRIGAEALLGIGEPVIKFHGPEKSQYLPIAERTLSTLNQGAGLSDLGLTQQDASDIASGTDTIGGFMTRISQYAAERTGEVQRLIEREQCRLWIIVAAGNDPGGDVAGLTRGQYASIDTDRLMTSTGANVVADLKRYPDKIGLLGSVLDARILHLPVIVATEVMRAFANEALKLKMKQVGLQVKGNEEAALTRLRGCELSAIFSSSPTGTLTRGKKLGSESREAFEKLASIATTSDGLLNRALADALVKAGLIASYEIERDFGTGLTRRTDIYAKSSTTPIRIEVMWRKKTSRAEIANYTLSKLANYGKAIGFLE